MADDNIRNVAGFKIVEMDGVPDGVAYAFSQRVYFTEQPNGTFALCDGWERNAWKITIIPEAHNE